MGVPHNFMVKYKCSVKVFAALHVRFCILSVVSCQSSSKHLRSYTLCFFQKKIWLRTRDFSHFFLICPEKQNSCFIKNWLYVDWDVRFRLLFFFSACVRR